MGKGGHRLGKRGRFLDGCGNVGSLGESRTGWGREFQSRGAVLEKALSPKVFSLDGRTVNVREEEDLRAREGG